MSEPGTNHGTTTVSASTPVESTKAAKPSSIEPSKTAEPAKPSKPPKPPNPVLRMMGIPNLPKKLPSRNWLIFWSVLASFTAAKMYDSRETKKAQQKWCDLVAHVSQQKMPVNQMPRRLTVFLAAMPGDGIGPSRQYFKSYIKPILVAASLDYEVIEGRKEGDVRYGTAEHIRRQRRKKGETGREDPEPDAAMAIENVRERMMIAPEPGVKGDLVLGRHTWKEYIRGIHEGWLGPLDEPLELEPPAPPLTDAPTEVKADNAEAAASPESTEKEKAVEEKKEEPKKKPYPPPAYLTISDYSSAPLSQHMPAYLEPSEPIHQQHLLGFLKTPQRIWNWLNRRHLQDQIGRQTAAIVLANYRPYNTEESFAMPSSTEDHLATKAPENDLTDKPLQTSAKYEQQRFLEEEEYYWHKSVRKTLPADDGKERVWLNDVVLDSRIAERMRKFELEPEQEERAKRIAAGDQDAKWAVPVIDLRSQQPILSDLDDDSMA